MKHGGSDAGVTVSSTDKIWVTLELGVSRCSAWLKAFVLFSSVVTRVHHFLHHIPT